MSAQDERIAQRARPDPNRRDVVLLDEPTTADLSSKVTDAWREFACALSELLPTLPTGAVLELTLDPTASGTGNAVYVVTVEASEDGALTALAVGNALLPEGYHMDRGAVAGLIALGWSPPGVVAGSGGNFGLLTQVAESVRLATVVTRTLRDIYGAPHPAFLVYLAHDKHGGRIPVEPLGTARPDAGLTMPETGAGSVMDSVVGRGGITGGGTADGAAGSGEETAHDAELLDGQVRSVVATLLRSHPDQLGLDPDGDISIRSGSAMVFVRVRENPPLVDVISPVLTEVTPTEGLYSKLSELTSRMPIGRLYCTNDTVWASVPVFGRNFQAIHLMLAVQVMTGLADELDDRLHGEFGGRRFFGESDKPHPLAPDQTERTGMYL